MGLKLTVNEKGFVEQAEATQGPLVLRPAASAFASHWVFQPVVMDGRPVKVQSRFEIPFRLKEAPSEDANHLWSQVVLEIEQEGGASTVPFDLAGVREAARAYLQPLGLNLVEASAADPQQAFHLTFHIQTLSTHDSLYLLNINERFSRFDDRAILANDPKQPGRICFINHVQGQKGPEGFQDNLVRVVRRSLEELVVPSVPKRQEVAKPPTTEGRSGPPERVLSPGSLAGFLDVDFSQIKVKHQPAPPHYPSRAKERGVQGTVVLVISVDATGKPVHAEAVEGPSDLLITAIRYALAWEFEAARLNGKAVPSRFKLTMPFRLREGLSFGAPPPRR